MDLSVVSWRKSSFSSSNGGACVEVGTGSGTLYLVRDSKDPDGGRLSFPAAQWRAFIGGIKGGDFAR